jgi:acyl carrier protein
MPAGQGIYQNPWIFGHKLRCKLRERIEMSYQTKQPAGSIKQPQEIAAWLVNQVSELLSIPPRQVDVQAPFNSFGLASRDAVLLSGDLEEWLDIRVSPTILYEYPNILALAAHLASVQKAQPNANASSAAQVQEKVNPTSLGVDSDSQVTQIEDLSDEEAEALLLEKLAGRGKQTNF